LKVLKRYGIAKSVFKTYFLTRVKLAVTSPSSHFRDLAKKTPTQKRADKLKKTQKNILCINRMTNNSDELFQTTFKLTVNLSASFFEYRTRLSNNGFLIN